MKKNCTSQAFLLIDTLIRMSPKHKNINRQFYLWDLCIAKGTMKDLSMGIKHIADKSDCSEDTVIRYLEKYPYLVIRQRRKKDPGSKKRKTNIYTTSETFIHAMQFMDHHGMIDGKTRRQQKTWYMNEIRKDLAFLNEDVGICDLQRRDLRPNPLLIPESLKSITGKGNAGSCHQQHQENKKASQERFITIPERVDRFDVPYEIKVKISMLPEGIFQSALDSSKWKNKHGWFIRDHTNYVIGQAIRMAKKQGIWLDWPAYYSTLKKYQNGVHI